MLSHEDKKENTTVDNDNVNDDDEIEDDDQMETKSEDFLSEIDSELESTGVYSQSDDVST